LQKFSYLELRGVGNGREKESDGTNDTVNEVLNH
jgi:hypothetical protein